MSTVTTGNLLSVVLRPKELEVVYAISTAIAQSDDIDAALDKIVKLTRHVFIFDNMVLYLPDQNRALDVTYARVVGRGRSLEADLAWGEGVATQAFEQNQTIVHLEKLQNWQSDRLCWREFLGLPLRSGDVVMGGLVFVRFGGPSYEPEQIRLAEFIAAHITQLLEHHRLVERIGTLEAERRLRRLQDDFIATVSHELRTPLGFIKGYATTLLREDITWQDETRREFLTVIDEEADKLEELISDLLDSSRLQAGTLDMQPQPINVDQLLREVVLRASTRYKDLTVQIQVKPSATIWADPVRVAQVFENLLSNAVKYAPGSDVYIDVEDKENWVRIFVRDKGPGIAPEHAEHLFERFYRVPTTRATVPGTGLGLFICRQIIRAHGGEIVAAANRSEGATFVIDLPRDGGQAQV